MGMQSQLSKRHGCYFISFPPGLSPSPSPLNTSVGPPVISDCNKPRLTLNLAFLAEMQRNQRTEVGSTYGTCCSKEAVHVIAITHFHDLYCSFPFLLVLKLSYNQENETKFGFTQFKLPVKTLGKSKILPFRKNPILGSPFDLKFPQALHPTHYFCTLGAHFS